MSKESSYVLFKGTNSQYNTLHRWVEKQLGKPQGCSICGKTSPGRYEWANTSGEYKKDITDWKRLCPKCHSIFDGRAGNLRKTHCAKGHPLTPDTTYTRPNGITRECLTCKLTYRAAQYQKMKAERHKSRPVRPYKRKAAI